MDNQSKVFHRHLQGNPAVATYGMDARVGVEGQHPVVDLSSGAGSVCLGYHETSILDAMYQQLGSLPYVHSENFTTQAVEQLAASLIDRVLTAPVGQVRDWSAGRAIFLNTGAEAIEAACKLAIQYAAEIGLSSTDVDFFARKHSYHGATLFTLKLGNHPRMRPYAQSLVGPSVHRFDAFLPSRLPQPNTLSPEEYANRCLSRLRDDLTATFQSGGLGVVVVEPIAGTTAEIEPSTADYLVKLRAICDETNALLIYDEILCGNYRTGDLFAWQYYSRQVAEHLDPDMIVLGKGLTGGYFPLSAVLVSGQIVKAIAEGSGRLWHSTTTQNHPLGCAAGLRALMVYDSIGPQFLDLSRLLREEIVPQLRGLRGVNSVEGVGALWGVRLWTPQQGAHHEIRRKALAAGVSIYTDGDGLGRTSNFFMLAPPYCIEHDDLREAVEKLRNIIRDT